MIWYSERVKACPIAGSHFWNASFILYFEPLIGLASPCTAATGHCRTANQLFLTYFVHHCKGGRGSSVGIATELRAGRFGVQNPVGKRFP